MRVARTKRREDEGCVKNATGSSIGTGAGRIGMWMMTGITGEDISTCNGRTSSGGPAVTPTLIGGGTCPRGIRVIGNECEKTGRNGIGGDMGTGAQALYQRAGDIKNQLTARMEL